MAALFEHDLWGPLLGSLIGAAVALAGGAAIAWVLVVAFGRWARQTSTRVDDLVVKRLASPFRWVLPLVALLLALPELDFAPRTHAFLKQALVIAITLAISWMFQRAVGVFEEVVAERATAAGSLRARSHYTQIRGLSNVVRFLIGLATVGLVLLSFAGVRQIGMSMLASAGVAGIIIGFAAKETLGTIVSGLVIAVAQPIRLDDAVVVEGELGFVEEIGLTFVAVRLLDRRCIVLPVGYFLERPFQNWSRSSTQVRSFAELYLDYSAPIDELRAELKKILDVSPNWDGDFWDLSVTDAKEHCMVVRATMSGAEARKALALRVEVREKLVTFVQARHPNAFPKLRTAVATPSETSPTGTPNPETGTGAVTTRESHS